MILNRGSESFDSPRKTKLWEKLRNLLSELGGMELNTAVQEEIVRSVQELNTFQGNDAKLISLARKKINRILQVLEKEMNVVAKNHHRTRWLVLGMTTFGVPMGIAIGLSLQNMAFLGIGISVGFAFGIAIGSYLDQKAAREGRQLFYEL